MRKIIVLMLVGITLITGCQPQKEEEVPSKNVKVIQAEAKKYPVTLGYVGTVESQDVRTSAFKTGGKIEEIFAKAGQQVRKGDKLIMVNEEDLKAKADIAKAQYEMAVLQYNKAAAGATKEELNQAKISVEIAERNYKETKATYESYAKLAEAGAISSKQLQDIKLKLDLEEKQLAGANEAYNKISKGAREEELEILKKQADIALTSYEQSKNLLEDSVLRSEIDGVILQIQVKEGDYVAQGMPVITIKGAASTVKVGVTDEDLSKIVIGMEAIVTHKNDEVKGKIESFSSMPKNQTNLYEVKIKLEQNVIPIGTMVDIDFILKEAQGLFVPMTSLLNEGFDYVYIIQDDTAVMKEVTLGEIVGAEIEIKAGISPGDKVIVEGMRSVKNEDKVNIKE